MLDTDLTFLNGVQFQSKRRTVEARHILESLALKYEFAGSGFYRAAFFIGSHVFKFPFSEAGEYCNDGEGSYRHEIYARGKWIAYKGFVCVMQERLRLFDFDNKIEKDMLRLPEYDWVGDIDCVQVGWDRQGRLKAYDFVHP